MNNHLKPRVVCRKSRPGRRGVWAPAWFALLVAGTGPALADMRDQSVVIRLETPIASYSPAGTGFSARVVGPVLHDGVEILPSGSTITGQVRRSASVRLGLLRERAMLELEFHGCRLPGGTSVDCEVLLEGVDNAREKVAGNRVNGVLAAGHPYSWLSGLWIRPAPALIPRSAGGLTGLTGTIYTRLAPTPVGAAVVLTARLLLYRLPDPEICLPAGTDLLVRVRAPDSPALSPQALAVVPPEVSSWVAGRPDEVRLPDGSLAGDIINLVFVASRQQVERAFLAAGWSASEPLTPRTFARMYAAFSSMRAYPTAPVAPLTYCGKTADLVFQKSLNTVAKRHHIRIWQASPDRTQVWLGAATHDIAIALDWKRKGLTHRIDPFVDRERSRVVNDLASAGCVTGISFVDRPHAARPQKSGKPSVTDGKAVLLSLGECSAPELADAELRQPRRRRITLGTRRFTLESRYYLTRGNPYYWAYRAALSLRGEAPRTGGSPE